MPPVPSHSGAIRQSERPPRNEQKAEDCKTMQCGSERWGGGDLVTDAGRRSRLLYSSRTPAGSDGRNRAGRHRVPPGDTPAFTSPFPGTWFGSEICIKPVHGGDRIRRVGRGGREGSLTIPRVEWGGDERQAQPHPTEPVHAAASRLPAVLAPDRTAERTPSHNALLPPPTKKPEVYLTGRNPDGSIPFSAAPEVMNRDDSN